MHMNSGLFYLRANLYTINLMRRIAAQAGEGEVMGPECVQRGDVFPEPWGLCGA